MHDVRFAIEILKRRRFINLKEISDKGIQDLRQTWTPKGCTFIQELKKIEREGTILDVTGNAAEIDTVEILKGG